MTTIELKEHPSRARDPVTNEILTDKDGQTLPLITDTRSIFINGQLAGYYGTKEPRNVMLIREYPAAVAELARAEVEKELGKPTSRLTMAPPLVADDEEDDE